MRVAPVSADLLVKLAVGAVLVGAAVLAMRSMVGAVQTAADGVWEPIDNALTTFGNGAREVNETAGGVIQNVGAAVGIPRTNVTACQLAISEGRTWDASFVCPAGTFLGSLFGSEPARPARPAQQADVRRVDNAIAAGEANGWTFPVIDYLKF